jgi:HlyD family type I secretion membrane fusion protein
MLLGGTVIVAFLGAFSTWSALAPIESAVVAPGVVSVDTNTKTVQHLEGGIVEEILVRDGDLVEAGDVLIRLENTLPVSVLNEIQSQYFEALATEARLVAERDGATEISFPEELRRKVADEAVRDAIAGQQSIFASRSQLRAEQQNILDRTIAGLEAEIVGFEGQIESANQQIALIDDELRDALTLREQGLMIKPRVLELQRQKAELEGSASSYRASIGTARQNIEQARLKMAETRANEVSAGAEALRAVRALAYELEQKLAAAADVMNRTEIRSPIPGTVVGLKVHTIGGVITAGEPLLDVVPLNEKLVIQASVDQLDIDQIHVGLPATIWLWALNRRNRAALEGHIETISADRLVDPNTGNAYYLARVLLDTEGADLASVTIQPGMSADVMIRTGERTTWSYLTTPIARGLSMSMREAE